MEQEEEDRSPPRPRHQAPPRPLSSHSRHLPLLLLRSHAHGQLQRQQPHSSPQPSQQQPQPSQQQPQPSQQQPQQPQQPPQQQRSDQHPGRMTAAQEQQQQLPHTPEFQTPPPHSSSSSSLSPLSDQDKLHRQTQQPPPHRLHTHGNGHSEPKHMFTTFTTTTSSSSSCNDSDSDDTTAVPPANSSDDEGWCSCCEHDNQPGQDRRHMNIDDHGGGMDAHTSFALPPHSQQQNTMQAVRKQRMPLLQRQKRTQKRRTQQSQKRKRRPAFPQPQSTQRPSTPNSHHPANSQQQQPPQANKTRKPTRSVSFAPHPCASKCKERTYFRNSSNRNSNATTPPAAVATAAKTTTTSKQKTKNNQRTRRRRSSCSTSTATTESDEHDRPSAAEKNPSTRQHQHQQPQPHCSINLMTTATLPHSTGNLRTLSRAATARDNNNTTTTNVMEEECATLRMRLHALRQRTIRARVEADRHRALRKQQVARNSRMRARIKALETQLQLQAAEAPHRAAIALRTMAESPSSSSPFSPSVDVMAWKGEVVRLRKDLEAGLALARQQAATIVLLKSSLRRCAAKIISREKDLNPRSSGSPPRVGAAAADGLLSPASADDRTTSRFSTASVAELILEGTRAIQCVETLRVELATLKREHGSSHSHVSTATATSRGDGVRPVEVVDDDQASREKDVLLDHIVSLQQAQKRMTSENAEAMQRLQRELEHKNALLQEKGNELTRLTEQVETVRNEMRDAVVHEQSVCADKVNTLLSQLEESDGIVSKQQRVIQALTSEVHRLSEAAGQRRGMESREVVRDQQEQQQQMLVASVPARRPEHSIGDVSVGVTVPHGTGASGAAAPVSVPLAASAGLVTTPLAAAIPVVGAVAVESGGLCAGVSSRVVTAASSPPSLKQMLLQNDVTAALGVSAGVFVADEMRSPAAPGPARLTTRSAEAEAEAAAPVPSMVMRRSSSMLRRRGMMMRGDSAVVTRLFA